MPSPAKSASPSAQDLSSRFRRNLLKLLIFAAFSLVAYGVGYTWGQKRYLEKQTRLESENTVNPEVGDPAILKEESQ